jgi:hypothetical protein
MSFVPADPRLDAQRTSLPQGVADIANDEPNKSIPHRRNVLRGAGVYSLVNVAAEGMRQAAVPPSHCGECELPLRWERIVDERGERWLALCACGMPWAFFPRRPDYRAEDPLREALGVARVTYGTSPPWIRLFQLTSGYPWWLPWRHVLRRCPSCDQCVTFGVWTRPRRDRCAYSSLCLACGRATSEYISATNRGMSEAPVAGNEWSPACIAVARLRRAVFCPVIVSE